MKPLCIPIAAWCLVIAGAPFHDYSIYQASRWLVSAAAIGVISQSRAPWFIAFGLVAVVFNPIVPLRLDRGAWQILDIGAAFLFLLRCAFKS